MSVLRIPGLLFKLGRYAVKGRKKVRKVKSAKTYSQIKASESNFRAAMGMKGKGKAHTMRRKVKGPVGYTALGASLFMGGDDE